MHTHTYMRKHTQTHPYKTHTHMYTHTTHTHTCIHACITHGHAHACTIQNIMWHTTLSKYRSKASTMLWMNSRMLNSFYILKTPTRITERSFTSVLSAAMIKYSEAYLL